MNNPNNPDDKKDVDRTESEASKSEDAVETDEVEVGEPEELADADTQESGSESDSTGTQAEEAPEPQGTQANAEDAGMDDALMGEASDGSLEGGPAEDTLAEKVTEDQQETATESSGEGARDPDPTAEQSNDDLYADDSQGGGGFAATALKLLLLVLFIFGLSLWLVPMIAPSLPDGIAKRLMPGQAVLEERLAALEASAAEAKTAADSAANAAQGISAVQEEVSVLNARLADAEAVAKSAQAEAVAASEAAMASTGGGDGAGDNAAAANAAAAALEAAEASATATAAATEAGKVAASAIRDTASLARQMTSFEARLANLRIEIEAIGDNLAIAATQEGGASTAEISAAFAALKARVDALADREPDLSAYIRRDESDGFVTHDDLRSARTALTSNMESALAALPEGGALATRSDVAELRGSIDGQVSALNDQIAAIGEKADAAAATAAHAEAEATAAVGTVAGAITGASLKSAVAALESQMANGVPFAAALDEVVTLTGATAPEALLMASTTGVQTTRALLRRFKPLAPRAIAEDLKAQSGDDALGQASARLQSIFAGRPKNEAVGDDVGAILSRVEARLNDGDVSAALTEAEALSDAAKTGLGSWLDDLRLRVDADAAAAAFLSDIGASQG